MLINSETYPGHAVTFTVSDDGVLQHFRAQPLSVTVRPESPRTRRPGRYADLAVANVIEQRDQARAEAADLRGEVAALRGATERQAAATDELIRALTPAVAEGATTSSEISRAPVTAVRSVVQMLLLTRRQLREAHDEIQAHEDEQRQAVTATIRHHQRVENQKKLRRHLADLTAACAAANAILEEQK